MNVIVSTTRQDRRIARLTALAITVLFAGAALQRLNSPTMAVT